MATTQHHSRFAEKARCAAHGGDKAAAQGRGPGKRAQAGRATGDGEARGEGRRAPPTGMERAPPVLREMPVPAQRRGSRMGLLGNERGLPSRSVCGERRTEIEGPRSRSSPLHGCFEVSPASSPPLASAIEARHSTDRRPHLDEASLACLRMTTDELTTVPDRAVQ